MENKGTQTESLPFEAAKLEEVIPLFQSAVLRSSRLQCWSPGRKHTFTSRIVKTHKNGGAFFISVDKSTPEGNEFESGVLKDSPDEVLFSLNLPTDVIFFRGELRKGEDGFFNVRIKGSVYKVQRRGALRLSITDSVSVEVFSPGQASFSGKLLNLSEGGIAVSFNNKAEFEFLSRPNTVARLTFKVFGITVDAEGSFRHGSEVGSTLVRKAYRVGFFFNSIDPKIRTQISQLVFEESAKYLGRL